MSQPRAHVAGIADPLSDARLVRLIAAFRDYRRVARFTFIAREGWRLVINDDGPVSYLPAPGEEPDDSATHLTDERLSSLIASGGLLADLFTTQPLGAGSPGR